MRVLFSRDDEDVRNILIHPKIINIMKIRIKYMIIRRLRFIYYIIKNTSKDIVPQNPLSTSDGIKNVLNNIIGI